jgi:hypothetical protein
VFLPSKINDTHGHVDIEPPQGCATNLPIYLYAPVSGTVEKYNLDNSVIPSSGYHLWLPQGTYIDGIGDALRFGGVTSPDLSLITRIRLDFGRTDISTNLDGMTVTKGDRIGTLVKLPYSTPYIIAYQIFVDYDGNEYGFSPTLFTQDGPSWICYLGTPYQ